MLEDEVIKGKVEELNNLRVAFLNRGTIRTYDFKRGKVKNHITGKEAPLKDVLNGDIDLIK